MRFARSPIYPPPTPCTINDAMKPTKGKLVALSCAFVGVVVVLAAAGFAFSGLHGALTRKSLPSPG